MPKSKDKAKGFDLMSLAPDESMSEEGVWIEFYDDAQLKIAQFQNSKYQAFINLKFKQHKRILDMEDEKADAMAEKISLEAAARFLLLDWKGIVIDGEEKPYSYKLGMEIMEKVPVLKQEVNDQSRKLFNFQKQMDEKDVENVKP